MEYGKALFTLNITYRYMLFLTLWCKIKIISFIIIVIIAPALNLAKCWKLFFSTQSAVNYLFLKTSRIFRDYTLSFICYINHIDDKHLNKLNNKKTLILYKNNFIMNNTKINSTFYRHFNQLSLNQLDKNFKIEPLSAVDKFSFYLTGLIEGDGTIIVPKTFKTRNRTNYPCIQIVFNLKDLALALLIQKELKHGSLSRKKGINAYVLTINSSSGLLYLISLINGKIKTPKIYSLFNLIDWYNLKNGTLNIEKKSLNTLPLSYTPWLSGFIEADGHFSVRSTLTGKYPKIECKFELCQSQIDHKGHNNLEFLETIAELLNTEVKSIRLNSQHPQYRVRTVNLTGNVNLKNSLNNFPLFGTKYLDYLDWLKVLDFFEKGIIDHILNMKIVLNIKSGMNDKRTCFKWNHLNKFYNLDK